MFYIKLEMFYIKLERFYIELELVFRKNIFLLENCNTVNCNLMVDVNFYL